MDLDNDGRRDVISGSWPGELYVFAPNDDGGFTRRILTHGDGQEINIGKASAVFATDWDRDGDLDLIVGEIGGKLFFIPDESATDEPYSFGDAVPLQRNDETAVASGHHSGPCVADWDGDGRNDLLVGAGDGSVTLFRTLNDEGMPTLAEGRVLVHASQARRTMSGAADLPATAKHGSRAKVAVADWNGDGRLDLLLGDFSTEVKPVPGLTDEQKQEKDELEAKFREVSAESGAVFQRAAEKAQEEFGFELTDADVTSEQRREFVMRLRELMDAEEGYAAIRDRMNELTQKLRAYRPGREYRGWVWLFTRKAPADAGDTTTTTPGDADQSVPPQDDTPEQGE